MSCGFGRAGIPEKGTGVSPVALNEGELIARDFVGRIHISDKSVAATKKGARASRPWQKS
ncbi:MAG: hypothetical protein ACR2OZ_17860 [Verrucomicrobiales bacterium]